MNVANLTNCKRLYELSGWEETNHYWHSLISHDMKRWSDYKLQDYKPDSDFGMRVIPAYSAWYLLRKLPKWGRYTTGHKEVQDGNTNLTLTVTDSDGSGSWVATMDSRTEHGWVDPQYADNPEDALCLLAIKLFEEGVLTKGDSSQPLRKDV